MSNLLGCGNGEMAGCCLLHLAGDRKGHCGKSGKSCSRGAMVFRFFSLGHIFISQTLSYPAVTCRDSC